MATDSSIYLNHPSTADGTTHEYLRDHGRIITIDGPAGVTVFDINERAQMVG